MEFLHFAWLTFTYRPTDTYSDPATIQPLGETHTKEGPSGFRIVHSYGINPSPRMYPSLPVPPLFRTVHLGHDLSHGGRPNSRTTVRELWRGVWLYPAL